jgi:hypothetical protein
MPFKLEMQIDTRHKMQGDPCTKCGVSSDEHGTSRKYKYRKGKKQKPRKDKRTILNYRYIGLDGEGQGDIDHRYTMMGASDEEGSETWTVKCKEGERLTTVQCLDFILGLFGRRQKVFTFSFNYDLTKLLMDLDNQSLYELFRPELRQRSGKWAILGPKPVKWNGYLLNLQGTKFTVAKDGIRVVVWDLFKFYQSKFVSALKDWKVGSKELWDRMTLMKDKRGEFERQLREGIITHKDIENYCLEECACMAKLARKLVVSHDDAGLKLKAFYGAGSSSAAMLTKMGIQDRIVPMIPEMKHAIASAFFGGRFENSIIGAVREPIYNMDISSAYPYQTTFLPCLAHGTWTYTTNRNDIEDTRAALINYTLGPNTSITDWGPFPFRTKNGSICFPIESGGGWVWKDEYLVGERAFPHVIFKGAWIYRARCDCKIFAEIPSFYILRLRLGKEGPGLVIKLAVNGVYGKLAQTLGNAIFNNWIWAGIITSGTRAQILEVMALHEDRSNLLMIATDGIKTREDIQCPKPIDLGTGILVRCCDKDEDKCKHPQKWISKPLGGWEKGIEKNGVFLARPGIYFPMNPTEDDIKLVKGRGVGKGIVLDNWRKIMDSYEKYGASQSVEVANVRRFCGAKTSISKSKYGYNRALGADGIKPSYGQWIERKVAMSFDPLPKREKVRADGLTLELRRFPNTIISVPYDNAMKSPEASEMKAAAQEMLEQPDCDFSDFEVVVE